jgi:diguanylate cyclase (GGDEF)-like protein/PAS domain S-box-containing protein
VTQGSPPEEPRRGTRLLLRQRYLLALLSLALAGIAGPSAALLIGHQRTLAEVQGATSENLKGALRDQFAARGRSLALVTAEALVNPLSLYDVEAVQEVVRAAQADPDLAYARVHDGAAGVVHEVGAWPPHEARIPAPAPDQAAMRETAGVLHVTAPVRLGNQSLGVLQIGLLLDGIERDGAALQARLDGIAREHRRSSTSALAAVAAALLGLSVLSAVLMAQRLSRPILALTGLAARVGRGDYEVEVFPDRRDELGDLARSFCAMARSLRDTTVSRDKFDLILGSMRDGLVVATPAGVITTANAAAGALVGCPAAELVGRSVAELLADGRTVQQAHDGHRLGATWVESSEAVLLPADGKRLPVLVSVSGLRDAAGVDEGIVCVFHDISDRKRAEARIRHMAQHDALTGLPNRALLQDRLVQATSRPGQDGRAVALLLLDLDHFKEVNDTLGHPIGDQLLEVVAARLRACVREADTVARLGGDEFAVVQVGLRGREEAAILCRRVVEALGQPFRLDGHDIFVGVSVGVALHPADGQDPDRLMRNADLALYRVKAEGRSTFRFFEDGMNARLHEQKALEADLRLAVEQNLFELHYQPQFDLRSGTLTGFEALLRWPHAKRGWVPPDLFIPLAERTGLIVPIGGWVLRTACAQAAAWRAQAGRDLRIAVNLSPVQFARQDVARLVESALRSTGLPPALLELEITEGVLLQDTEANLCLLRRLKALGARIALDDFGTGYSSLGYLRSFPFDTLKIDRSFVRDLATDPGAAAIVRAALELTRSLGMAAVAEGIETAAQLELLEAEGCRQAQGYHLGRPMAALEAGRLLERSLAGPGSRPRSPAREEALLPAG